MAVDSYIPTDVKLTVEKKVKEKPRKEDLITVEKIGRNFELDKVGLKNVQSKRKVKPRSDAVPEKAGKDYILIITEKPQAAMKIASALGDAKKISENKVSYYEVYYNNEKILVASAVGHLFNLTYSPGQKGWPVFKTEWVPAFTKAAYIKSYYNLIAKLVKRAKQFIVATDFDIEGEVIGWNIIRFIAKQKDAKRMKFSTLTKDELKRSYDNALSTIAWGQAYAGEARHIIDWLYGINMSRALMSAIKTAGSFKILSIGRVQGPALKIIVDREKEIREFKPIPYWQVFAYAKGIEFKHVDDIFEKEKLKEFDGIKEGVAETKEKTETVMPPHPFDLTSLQREAYNLLRIPPSRTLQIAQSLYLDGIISYPRTSSQKIPESIGPKDILKKLQRKYKFIEKAVRAKPVEGEKSDPAHPSIYPTGEVRELEDEQKALYELILKRFVSCFCEDALVDRKRIVLVAKDKKFTANGSIIRKKGWMEVYPANIGEKELESVDGKVKVDEVKFVEKETEPPKRYSPASLITILEKKNLGTKTTRSMIIDTLFDRGYLDGRSIEATPLGIRLIEALEKYSPIIIDENLTTDLEKKMEGIQHSGDLYKEEQEVIVNVERLISDISKSFKQHELEIGKSLVAGNEELREITREQNTLMPCPICKQGNLAIKYSKKTSKYFVACDKYPDCKTTYNLPPNSLIKNTGKKSEDGLPLLLAIRKGKKPWEFKFDPNWKPQN